jgi:hypothetical protein
MAVLERDHSFERIAERSATRLPIALNDDVTKRTTTPNYNSVLFAVNRDTHSINVLHCSIHRGNPSQHCRVPTQFQPILHDFQVTRCLKSGILDSSRGVMLRLRLRLVFVLFLHSYKRTMFNLDSFLPLTHSRSRAIMTPDSPLQYDSLR